VSTITKTWVCFAAIGTGLIHLALVIGSPAPLAVVLGILGLAEFGWGVVTFARERIAAPRAVLAVAIAPIIGWGLVLLSSTVFEGSGLAAALGVLPLAIATLFELFVAGAIGRTLRREGRQDARQKPPGTARYLVGVLLGGLAVAALTTPALAYTQAAALAQHPDYDFVVPAHGH
jgi:hypothetical protein